ncbi:MULTISPECIES: SMI1/KNR4 family protein [Streptomyces]|uniref:SMI1/KNR4 family protein n=1 Tax=Streptomyces sudanensis TaxID=436397 RepID=A0ABY4TDY0_9ACTN|nr:MULTISPECIES: SMI1/KNR4 family protein [Streptomyces]MCP9958652.1 SMI1/KNR4 family protein [Streptomyces sudanensis]MCP9987754.1 SMI1/KNR4 family protein [Streptomyces sudanensis]MCQ0000852.1 SMI1/KNR4 family protein [Streptomyces sudanensis]URN16430.1 SMI1/KNR4 family protein [Streptomyces sudanensis]
MTQRIPPPSESWRRIDAWAATHAPADFALLNPPAAPDGIRRAEQILGVPLPGDLVESLRCHDGASAWTTVLPEQSPLTVSGIADQWRICMDVAVENEGLTPRPWEDEPWWHSLWIPWAEGADGTAQVIDLRPGPAAGRLGWAGHGGGGDFTDSRPGLADLLHAVARALHEGGGVHGLHPYLTAHGGMWWDEEGRGELDGHPLRAAPIGPP